MTRCESYPPCFETIYFPTAPYIVTAIYMTAVSYCSWRLFPFTLENLITKTYKGNFLFLTLP